MEPNITKDKSLTSDDSSQPASDSLPTNKSMEAPIESAATPSKLQATVADSKNIGDNPYFEIPDVTMNKQQPKDNTPLSNTDGNAGNWSSVGDRAKLQYLDIAKSNKLINDIDTSPSEVGLPSHKSWTQPLTSKQLRSVDMTNNGKISTNQVDVIAIARAFYIWGQEGTDITSINGYPTWLDEQKNKHYNITAKHDVLGTKPVFDVERLTVGSDDGNFLPIYTKRVREKLLIAAREIQSKCIESNAIKQTLYPFAIMPIQDIANLLILFMEDMTRLWSMWIDLGRRIHAASALALAVGNVPNVLIATAINRSTGNTDYFNPGDRAWSNSYKDLVKGRNASNTHKMYKQALSVIPVLTDIIDELFISMQATTSKSDQSARGVVLFDPVVKVYGKLDPRNRVANIFKKVEVTFNGFKYTWDWDNSVFKNIQLLDHRESFDQAEDFNAQSEQSMLTGTSLPAMFEGAPRLKQLIEQQYGLLIQMFNTLKISGFSTPTMSGVCNYIDPIEVKTSLPYDAEIAAAFMNIPVIKNVRKKQLINLNAYKFYGKLGDRTSLGSGYTGRTNFIKVNGVQQETEKSNRLNPAYPNGMYYKALNDQIIAIKPAKVTISDLLNTSTDTILAHKPALHLTPNHYGAHSWITIQMTPKTTLTGEESELASIAWVINGWMPAPYGKYYMYMGIAPILGDRGAAGTATNNTRKFIEKVYSLDYTLTFNDNISKNSIIDLSHKSIYKLTGVLANNKATEAYGIFADETSMNNLKLYGFAFNIFHQLDEFDSDTRDGDWVGPLSNYSTWEGDIGEFLIESATASYD